ncbi:MAG TPA: S41 family peptidase [Anaeromyxobacter sp.]
MHIALALSTLLATLDSPAGAPVSRPAPLADPCAASAAPAPEPSCGAAPLCAAKDRVRVACELRDAMRTRYVFLDEKPALLGGGFDSAARLDACVADERAIGREDDPLRFYDRVRKCLGAFQDGHLLVGAPVRLPQVALGLGLRRTAGRIVVASLEPALRRLAGERALEVLPVGAEVVEIDGRPVAEAALALGALVPGSSPAARLERAVGALTRRDFAHPAKRTATLTVMVGGERRTIDLPWWVSPIAAAQPVAAAWARRTAIPATDLLPWFEDAVRPRPGAAPGSAPSWAPVVPPAAAAALREYADDGGRVAVRLGALERAPAAPVCYLQILSFHTEGLAGIEGRRPFAQVVDEFVRGCAAKRLDLVLDLRRNEGGFLDHSTAVAEALAPAGTAEPAAALLLRATERNEAVYRERSGASLATAPADVLAPRHVLDAIGAARRDGRALTPAFVPAPLRSRPSVGGFSGRVVALTSPACMSACDRLAALLRASGRAILVGGPTEGAGGSQQETPALPARFTDSAKLLTVAIPNATFGVPRAPAGPVVPASGLAATPARASGPGGSEIPDRLFFEMYGIENRPVEPDIRYEPSLDDVIGNGRGWLEQVERALGGTGASPLAAARSRPASAAHGES